VNTHKHLIQGEGKGGEAYLVRGGKKGKKGGKGWGTMLPPRRKRRERGKFFKII